MKLKYFAWVKDITGTHFEEINDTSVKDVNTLINLITKKYPKLKKYFNEGNIIRIAVNLEYTSSNRKISQSDEIAFFPPVSGG